MINVFDDDVLSPKIEHCLLCQKEHRQFKGKRPPYACDVCKKARTWFALLLESVEFEKTPAKGEGGGIVVKCKHCGGSWWLDETDEQHNDPDCFVLRVRKEMKDTYL